jgi:hypothetical protein
MRDGKGDGQCWDSGCTNTEHTRSGAISRYGRPSHACVYGVALVSVYVMRLMVWGGVALGWGELQLV